MIAYVQTVSRNDVVDTGVVAFDFMLAATALIHALEQGQRLELIGSDMTQLRKQVDRLHTLLDQE